MLTIFLILLLLYFYKVRHYNYIFFIFIFINVGIPNKDRFEETIGLIPNSRFIILVIMLIFLLIHRKKTLFSTKSEFIIYTIIFSSIIIGILNGKGNPFMQYDLRVISNVILTFFVFFKWIAYYKIKIDKVIRYYMVSGIIFSIITLILYLFFKGEFIAYIYGDVYGSIWGDRITFPNNSSQYITILLSTYFIFIKSNIALNYFSILLNGISVLMSQNRTVISLLIVMLIFVLFVLTIYTVLLKKIKYINSSIIFIACSIIISLVFILSQSTFVIENKLISDLLARFTQEGSGSFEYRTITNSYAIETVENKFFGDGIGEEMWSGGYLPYRYIGSLVDNMFISIYVKLGVFGVVLISSLLIFAFIRIVKFFIKTKNILYLILFCIYPGYIVISALLTSQLLHSPSVYLSFYLLLFLANNSQSLKKSDISIEESQK